MKDIYSRYDDFLQDLNNHKDNIKESKVYKYFEQRSKICKTRRLNLYKNYPCGYKKIRYRDGKFQMAEIGTNQKL